MLSKGLWLQPANDRASHRSRKRQAQGAQHIRGSRTGPLSKKLDQKFSKMNPDLRKTKGFSMGLGGGVRAAASPASGTQER